MTPPGSDPLHVPYVTVKDAVPLLAEYELSPAKLAPTPDGYVPGKIPDRLAPVLVATPLLLVVALPTTLPFRVKLMVLPLTADPLEVSVADRLTVPP
jgi:hypothetical protein